MNSEWFFEQIEEKIQELKKKAKFMKQFEVSSEFYSGFLEALK